MTEHITSRKNPLVTQIRKLLSDRGWRRECGQFVGDGRKLLEEAARWQAPLTVVVSTPDLPLPVLPDGVRRVTVPADVMESLSPMRTPQGALFLCRMPDTALPQLKPEGRYLVLDGVQDPGNVGTIWRTADAFGADGLILVNGCADPWNHKTVRATMGAAFRLPVWEARPEQLCDALTQAGLPLYATALREDTADVTAVALDRCAVVIGSEGSGVSAGLLARAERTLRIPMRARCESLNAAIAAAVVLWEMSRQG